MAYHKLVIERNDLNTILKIHTELFVGSIGNNIYGTIYFCSLSTFLPPDFLLVTAHFLRCQRAWNLGVGVRRFIAHCIGYNNERYLL